MPHESLPGPLARAVTSWTGSTHSLHLNSTVHPANSSSSFKTQLQQHLCQAASPTSR